MAIQELLNTIAPPEHPINTGSLTDWHRVEEAIGLRFPSDLHELCVHYGSGRFAGITIYNPFSPNYQHAVRGMLDIFRGLREDIGQTVVPFGLFPEHPGLFPVGKEANGGTIFLLVDGIINEWPLILTDTSFRYQRFDMPLTTFLSKLFRKEIGCIWWPRSELDECYPDVRYIPFTTTGTPPPPSTTQPAS
jgi:hypothetical protein